MDREEAKFILSAVKSDDIGTDNDKKIAEALKMAESDELLGQWFQEIQEFDSLMKSKLQDIPVPQDLKSNILTGIKVSQVPKARRRRSLWLAAAAVIFLTGLALWQTFAPVEKEKISITEFHNGMLEQLKQLRSIDQRSGDPAIVTNYLAGHGVPPDFAMPARIENNVLIGCKVLKWHGHKVTLICFDDPDSGKGAELHVMTIHADAIKEYQEQESTIVSQNEWSSTVWKSGEQVYFIAAKNAADRDLRKLLPLG
ncbi:MAG: hypothetical protein P1V20_06170 [Verrucomicrobiales bacterium]|nr:hypothetical protein [Verrucomicrobiales bacterium]